MPQHVWTAEHEHEHEHLHRLLHQGDSVLVQKWPARLAEGIAALAEGIVALAEGIVALAEGIAARSARQARARQTEGWP